jgi:hypothetical protein
MHITACKYKSAFNKSNIKRTNTDLHNGALDKGLGSDKFIVGGIVHHIENTGLTGHRLTTP